MRWWASVDAAHPVDGDLFDEFEFDRGILARLLIRCGLVDGIVLRRAHGVSVQRGTSALARWVNAGYCVANTFRRF